MYSGDYGPEVKQWAKDFIDYSFITSGGNFGVSTTYDLIPFSVLKDKDIILKFNNAFEYNNVLENEDILDQIVRNNFDSSFIESITNKNIKLDINTNLFFLQNNGIKKYSKYTYLRLNNLALKKVGLVDGEPVYKAINKLGFLQESEKIFEYKFNDFIDKSQYPINNTGSSIKPKLENIRLDYTSADPVNQINDIRGDESKSNNLLKTGEVKNEYKGKIIYAPSGAGKSKIAQLNNNVIDLESYYRDTLRSKLQNLDPTKQFSWKEESLQEIVINDLIGKENVDIVKQEVIKYAKQKASEGSTVLSSMWWSLSGPEKFVDEVITYSGLAEAQRRVDYTMEESYWSWIQNNIKKSGLPIESMSENQYISDLLLKKSIPAANITPEQKHCP